MRERWHAFANAVLSGEVQSTAYARIYGVKPETARANSSRLMQVPAFMKLLSDLREARQLDEEGVRAEIVAGHLADIRNESLSAADRRAARIALSKVYGLELNKAQVKVESNSVDEYIREQLNLCEIATQKQLAERLARNRCNK